MATRRLTAAMLLKSRFGIVFVSLSAVAVVVAAAPSRLSIPNDYCMRLDNGEVWCGVHWFRATPEFTSGQPERALCGYTSSAEAGVYAIGSLPIVLAALSLGDLAQCSGMTESNVFSNFWLHRGNVVSTFLPSCPYLFAFPGDALSGANFWDRPAFDATFSAGAYVRCANLEDAAVPPPVSVDSVRHDAELQMFLNDERSAILFGEEREQRSEMTGLFRRPDGGLGTNARLVVQELDILTELRRLRNHIEDLEETLSDLQDCCSAATTQPPS